MAKKEKDENEEIIDMISDSEGFFNKLLSTEIEDIEIDKLFERALQENVTDMEELMRYAPWVKLEGEDDLAYECFKYFVNLEIDDWEPESIKRFIDMEESDIDWYAKQHDWKERRMAYLKYQEYIRRRSSEVRQIEDIKDFKQNQHELLKKSSRAAVSLVGKLEERIADVKPEEIKTTDIPKFIQALSTFIDMASDAEARYNTVNELLALFEEEINTQAVKQHIKAAEKDRLDGK